MKSIGLEVRSLLDKLYNLKSDDSVILGKINSDQVVAEEKKVSSTEEKNNLSENINMLEQEELLLTEEGELLKEAIKNVNKSSFNVVLNKIGVDFNPGDISFSIEKNLPETINSIKKDKELKLEKLSFVEKELSDTSLLLDELEMKKSEALSNQNKLKEYFELAMKGNINTTRDNLTKLFSKFGLNDEEQREAAKILMFPEDSLYEYENNYKETKKTGKSFSDVFKEAKDDNIEEVKVPIIEPISLEEIKIIDLEESSTPEIELPKITEENIVTNNNSSIDVKSLIETNGFDYSTFTNADVSFLEQNANEDIFNKNVNLIRNMGINNDIFIENIELFIDDELDKKLNILLEIGKLPFDIYLNPNILIKYDVSELQSSIDSLKNSGLDPKKVPLMAY